MTDVIVIGAGGGGPVVAKELAARGLDVLVLEAGPPLRRPGERVDPFRGRHQQSDHRAVPPRAGGPLGHAVAA
ncbi:FAD-binding protein [Rhodococcus rhodochrous]